MANEISTWFKFAIQQMAAESYLDGINLQDSAAVIGRLVDGNNNSQVIPLDQFAGKTRFVNLAEIPNASQIPGGSQAFVSRYQIIDHHANDATGFSATLMQERGTNKFTLSFRSTEYRNQSQGGDYERDGANLPLLSGADGEILTKGFAFGQLAAMEQYYHTTVKNLLPQGAVLNVTGYSLGAHLATVFTELHGLEINPSFSFGRTYTFNGPGRGEFSDGPQAETVEAGRIHEMVTRLTQVLNDPMAGIPQGTPEELWPSGLNAAVVAWQLNPTWNPWGSGSVANVYTDARYLWAKQVVEEEFSPVSRSLSDINRTDGAFNLITQIVGHATQGDTEYVANSGNHARETRVYIEDQPNLDGFGGFFGTSGDFGTTHSITLIVDSLATQELFQTTAPSLGQSDIEAIFAASSNQLGAGFVGTSGVAEGDSLENALDALGKLFVPNYTPTQFGRQTGDFGSLTFRNPFYANLAAVKAALAGGTVTIEPLVELNAQGAAGIRLAPAQVKAAALEGTDRGAAFRYALKALNPFAVIGADYQGLGHASGGALMLFDPATGFGELTQQYLIDRAAFLEAKVELNLRNATTSGDTVYYKDFTGAGYEIPTGSILTTDQRVLFGSDADDPPLVGNSREDHLYGGGGNDLLDGQGGGDYLEGNAGNDVLLGGSGADALLGRRGDDLLEGGDGSDLLDGGLDNDMLRGGSGLDTYVIRAIDGADTIEDSDGKGSIEFGGRILTGGLRRHGEPTNTFHSADGTVTFTRQGADLIVAGSGPLTIANFTDGILGIKLFGEADYAPVTRSEFTRTVSNPNPPPATTQVPFFDDNANHSGDLEDPMTDSRNNLVHALGGDDTVISGSGDDQLYGEAGHDQLFGGLGDDRLFGGADADILVGDDSNTPNVGGDDYLDGGDGNDLLQGNAGRDILIGGSGNDNLNGDDPLAANLGTNDDWLDGGDNNDELHGAAGSDVLIGGSGDDLLIGDTTAAQGGDPAAGGGDSLDGGEGNDTLYGLYGDDLLVGGIGNDQLNGQDGSDLLLGGDGDDQLLGDLRIRLNTASVPYWEFDLSEFHNAGGEDVLDGGNGNDVLVGGEGDDVLDGGSGDDKLFGDYGGFANAPVGLTGDDLLIGGEGNDELVGGLGDDILDGGEGNDSLSGDGGADFLDGGIGNDNLSGGDGDDVLDAGDGNDTLYGDDGNDVLDAGDGDDVLVGGLGSDVLIGGAGNDELRSSVEFFDTATNTLEGGAGDDTYWVRTVDTVIEETDGGIDRVHTNESYVLPDEVELLTLHADLGNPNAVPVSAIGNAKDNTLEGPGNPLGYSYPDGIGHFNRVTLDGRAGNDMLIQGQTYIFGRDYGQDTIVEDDISGELTPPDAQDTIVMAAGVAPNDVTWERANDDLILRITGTNDQLTIPSYYSIRLISNDSVFERERNYYVAPSLIETVQFADGTVWGAYDTFGAIQIGEMGDNTYTFGRGFGTRTILDYDFGMQDGVDTVQMTEDVASTDVIVSRVGNDFVLRVTGTDDQLTIASTFASSSFAIEQTVFSDGTVWDDAALFGQIGELIGTSEADALIGNSRDNLLKGLEGDDRLEGGAGEDLLDGGSGNDLLIGGLGEDALLFGPGSSQDTADDQSFTTAEMNTIQMGAGVSPSDLTVSAMPDESLVMSINGTSDQLTLQSFFANPFNQTYRVAFADGIVWDTNTLIGQVAGVTLIGTPDQDFLVGSPVNDLLSGLGGDDVLEGRGGADTLLGGEGNDELFGDAGSDTMIGGPGDDIYRDIDDPGDVVIEAQSEGIDTVWSLISLTLSDQVENLRLTGDNPISGTGNVLDNLLAGNSADNVLEGGAGNDILSGGPIVPGFTLNGNDTLRGGPGNDTYLFGFGGGLDVIEDVRGAGAGNRIEFGLGVTLSDVTFERNGNTLDIKLLDGSAGTLRLTNFDPNGVNGSLVVETLAFADGSTTSLSELFPSNVNHAPTVATPLEDRTIQEDVPFTMTVAVDAFADPDAGDLLTFSASLAHDGPLPSWLSFDAGTRTFSGTPDNGDVGSLEVKVTATDSGSLSASDTFNLTVTNVSDAPTVASPIVDQSAQTGAAFSFTVPSNTFSDIDVGDTLTYVATLADSSALPVWLSFDTGTRTFSGTPGSGDAGVLNLKVTATDSESLSVADDFTLTISAADQTLTGTAGNDVLTGGVGNDQLFGLAGNDTLIGGAGNDLLDGGPDTDNMQGGSGDDIYVVDNSGDVVTENTGEGTDTVRSSIAYTLGANVENLTLIGSANINGSGNALDNVLIGNSGNNTLTGGAGNDRLDGGLGNDTMIGGLGNDTFVVNQVGDVITESANQGIDTVESAVTYNLGSNVENLTLTGTANINGTGSSANNVLLGNSGNNQLDGGSGNDTMDGGAGNDSLFGGSGNDILLGGLGNDLLNAGSGNDVLDGGDGVDVLDGGSGNDHLIGGAGNDQLGGGSGADHFTGGAGNDMVTGGSGNDSYTFARGDDQDTISDADSTSGNQDRVLFGDTINPLDVVLSRQANDLRLAVYGSTDQVTIQNWYAGATNQIETIQAGNGRMLLNTQVDQLIQAMAGFTQQTGLTWEQGIAQQPQQVESILAASWH